MSKLTIYAVLYLSGKEYLPLQKSPHWIDHLALGRVRHQCAPLHFWKMRRFLLSKIPSLHSLFLLLSNDWLSPSLYLFILLLDRTIARFVRTIWNYQRHFVLIGLLLFLCWRSCGVGEAWCLSHQRTEQNESDAPANDFVVCWKLWSFIAFILTF